MRRQPFRSKEEGSASEETASTPGTAAIDIMGPLALEAVGRPIFMLLCSIYFVNAVLQEFG